MEPANKHHLGRKLWRSWLVSYVTFSNFQNCGGLIKRFLTKVCNSHYYLKLDESEFYLYLNGIIERIKFVPNDFIGIESRQKAYDLCKDVDIKDTAFIALSIELNVPIWTGDKKLKEGLKSKGFDNFCNE